MTAPLTISLIMIVEHCSLKMDKEIEKKPWRDGNYKSIEGGSAVTIHGEKMTVDGTSFESTLSFGNFGEADPKISEITGEQYYNVPRIIHQKYGYHCWWRTCLGPFLAKTSRTAVLFAIMDLSAGGRLYKCLYKMHVASRAFWGAFWGAFRVFLRDVG